MPTFFPSEPVVAVVGLGYVGLPLSVAFGTRFPTLGFDTHTQRVQDIQNGQDQTRQITSQQLESAVFLSFTDQLSELRRANVYLIAVPTPVDASRQPDLSYLREATRMVGSVLNPGDVVVYESTVFPGCTEDICVPLLEQSSGLIRNQDFFFGYSPERINPGDTARPLTAIKKVTSGSTPEAAAFIDSLYQSVITAGTFRAASIRVAEASKAIENAQRDVNISFMNELALLFDRLGIDTQEVLEAAATKWNFLNFRPGLVGGHCISVDPYYLLHKAESVGYYPQVLLSGRRINDQMGVFIAGKVVKLMIKKGHRIEGSRVLILGVTYKENCPDSRNSKVIDIIRELTEFGLVVDVYDPVASAKTVQEEWSLTLTEPKGTYEAIILAVAHDAFLSLDWALLRRPHTVVYDVKSVLPKELVDGRL